MRNILMRVLLIITDLRGGGAQKVTITLGRGLADRGHEVHLLLFHRLCQYAVPPGVFTHVLTPIGNRLRSGWLGKRLLAAKLKQWCKAAGPFDLTLVSLPFAAEVVALARLAPVWHHIHNSLSAEIDTLSKRSARRARRRLKRYRRLFDGSRLVAVSKGVAGDLRDGIGITGANIDVIYNAFDFEAIRALAAEPEPDLPPRPYIIHAGRFASQKRHDLLFEAYSRAGIEHDLVLLVESSPGLVSLIKSFGLSSRVTVAGFRQNPFPWYAHASALVVTSDFEGFGNVLVEALACGTPVVSTDCRSGPSEILTGSLSRYLSPVGDAEALARNLRSAVSERPTIDPAILNRFSLQNAIDQIESLAKISRCPDMYQVLTDSAGMPKSQ